MAYYSGVVLSGLVHACIVWLMEKSELPACTVSCASLWGLARGVMSSQTLEPKMVSGLAVLVPLSSACWQPIYDIGFLIIVDASRFDPALSYVTHYRSELVGCSSPRATYVVRIRGWECS